MTEAISSETPATQVGPDPAAGQEAARKPLGRKGYGSIGHLPGSRTGPADHTCDPGQAVIATQRARSGDRVIVTEKLDGTNVGVLRIDGDIVAINRAGWPARTSPYEMHRHFADWVEERRALFLDLLGERERFAGEWIELAHGTRYAPETPDDLFIVFDLIDGKTRKDLRLPYDQLIERIAGSSLRRAGLVSDGPALAIEDAMERLGAYGFHAALDGPEGAVWRVETKGRFNFIAKYVRPEKLDGRYLEQITGGAPVWNACRQIAAQARR